MSDRLTELQRQRALAQEQVAWFDREIAREQGLAPAAPSPVAPATPVAPPASTAAGIAPTGPTPASDSEVERQAEEILQRFKHAEHPVRDDVRRGCFMYFFCALALLGLALFAFYMLHHMPE